MKFSRNFFTDFSSLWDFPEGPWRILSSTPSRIPPVTAGGFYRNFFRVFFAESFKRFLLELLNRLFQELLQVFLIKFLLGIPLQILLRGFKKSVQRISKKILRRFWERIPGTFLKKSVKDFRKNTRLKDELLTKSFENGCKNL